MNQLIKICSYIPVLQQKILSLIIGKCLELDVEIVIEDTGEVTLGTQNESNTDTTPLEDQMFLLEDCACNQRQGRRDEASAQRIRDEVSDMADKLDEILSIVTTFIHSKLLDNNTEQGYTSRLFTQLQQIFEEQILVTHRSKYVQYILFFCCAKSPRYAMLFARRLLQLFLDVSLSPLQRQSAVMYLGSYLARANYVPLHIIR